VNAGKRRHDLLLKSFGVRRDDEEHADEREPQPSRGAVESQQDAEGDQQVAEPSSQTGGGVGGRADVAAEAPERPARRRAGTRE
jgi:hypothetical protein